MSSSPRFRWGLPLVLWFVVGVLLLSFLAVSGLGA
jgi:hypothetical protein